jgi:Fe2+ transport system protein B
LSEVENDMNENTENLSASELKKLKNKQKKQQLKAQAEKDKQAQIEQKKKEINKQKAKEDGDVETINEDELMPEKLERVFIITFLNIIISLLLLFFVFQSLKIH